MKIHLERLFGKEAALRLRNLGLHKIAAARLRAEGHQIPDQLDLRSAVQALGSTLFYKNAEYKSIVDGLVALGELEKSAGWKQDMLTGSQEATQAAMKEMQELQERGDAVDPREFLTNKGFRYLGGQQWLTPIPEQFQDQYSGWQKENPGQIYFDSLE